MPVESTLVIGGCRSGKSSHALALGSRAAGDRNLFLATCVPHDAEMKARVNRHQQERGSQWQTIEAPIDIDQIISRESASADIILVDCLTLWITNLIMAHAEDAPVLEKVDGLCRSLNDVACPVILVANEVGTGIVPENALARRFRDMAGWTNQKVASACGTVVWMVAGIPVTVKTRRVEGLE